MPDAPKQISLTIDGKPVTVSDGTTVLQACEKADSPVPFYCYHPGLSIAGNCRICLVEIQGAPKLQIACYTLATNGMVVFTTSDPTLKGRKDVLEFLLINHPLDCPVCDQAGECWLQDYYMRHGLYDPKFNEAKTKKPKAVPLGPTVMLDAERCILCSRCVRFTDEITKTGEFGIFNRGDHSVIGLHPGKTLENNYSGNVVDICPVGALTDRDFRFKCRVWYLGATDSVCTGCSRGCNTVIHNNRERDWRPHIADGGRVMRLKPRFNADVNKWWMCDEGRYGYKFIDENRLAAVQVRESGAQRAATWEEGLGRVANALAALRQAKQLDRAGVILSSHLTNEDLFAAQTFFKKLGLTNVVFQRPKPGKSDQLLLQADKSPNARGAQALGIAEGAQALLARAAKKELKLLWVFTQDLTQVFDAALVRQAAAGVELFIFQGTNANPTADMAHVVLPSTVCAEKEGTLTNFQGRVQRIQAAVLPAGDSRADIAICQLIGELLQVELPFADAASTFAQLAAGVPAFTGMTYANLGQSGALLRNGTSH